jgi:hypothetical protein
MPARAIVTKENLSSDFVVDPGFASGPLRLNLGAGFRRDPDTGVISAFSQSGGGDPIIFDIVSGQSEYDMGFDPGTSRCLVVIGISTLIHGIHYRFKPDNPHVLQLLVPNLYAVDAKAMIVPGLDLTYDPNLNRGEFFASWLLLAEHIAAHGARPGQHYHAEGVSFLSPPVGHVDFGFAPIPALPGLVPAGIPQPEHHGWTPDLTSAAATSIVTEWMEAGYSKVQLAPRRTYVLDHCTPALTADIILDMNGSAIIGSTGAEFLEKSVFSPDGESGVRRGFTMRDGTLGSWMRVNVPTEGSGSGMAPRYFSFAKFKGVFFDGGARGDGFSDTGISPHYCNDVTFEFCRFRGHDDHAIYFTAGAGEDASQDTYNVTVRGCFFEGSGAGDIRLARGMHTVIIEGNYTTGSEKLVIGAGGENDPATVDNISITGNHSLNSTGVVIDLRYTNVISGQTITGNHIYDWNQPTASGDVGGDGMAINVRGCSNTLVLHNIIKPRKTANVVGERTCQLGIYITHAFDTEGNYFRADNVVVDHNLIDVFDRSGEGVESYCIYDATGTAFIGAGNQLLQPYPRDIYVPSAGSGSPDASVGSPYVQRRTALGVGLGGAIPSRMLNVIGGVAVQRSPNIGGTIYPDVPSQQYVAMASDGGAHGLYGRSSPDNAKALVLDASTYNGAAPTTGSLAVSLRTQGAERAVVTNVGLGVGKAVPEHPAHIVGTTRIERDVSPGQAVQITPSTDNIITSFSAPGAAKRLIVNVTTNSTHDAVTGGALDFDLMTLGVTRLRMTQVGDVGIGPSALTPSTRLHVSGPIRHATYTVATLPSASAVGAGTQATVSDAGVPAAGRVVSGGGTRTVLVESNGTAWIEGGIAPGKMLAPLGSAADPGIAFDGDPNTGIFSPAADQIGIATGGVQRALITTALIHLGMLTHVQGRAIITRSDVPAPVDENYTLQVQAIGDASIKIQSGATNSVYLGMGTVSDALNAGLSLNNNNGLLSIRAGGGNRISVLSAGDVGIGTSSPTTRLHAAGPIRHATYTVATLPSASAVGAGTRAAVTDANATTFNSVVAGGGANFVPVISDGTNWRIG